VDVTETMPQACPVRQPGLKPAGIESKEPAEIKGGDRCKVAWKQSSTIPCTICFSLVGEGKTEAKGWGQSYKVGWGQS